jgi:hypothetical protein
MSDVKERISKNTEVAPRRSFTSAAFVQDDNKRLSRCHPERPAKDLREAMDLFLLIHRHLQSVAGTIVPAVSASRA